MVRCLAFWLSVEQVSSWWKAIADGKRDGIFPVHANPGPLGHGRESRAGMIDARMQMHS